MFNWLSRRNQSAKPKSRGAREVVSEIADVDSLDALARIAGALETLRESSLSLEGRFDEIHRLDIAGQPKLMDLTQEYLMTLRHQKAHESRLWGVANGYLRELYQTYLFCLRRYLADPQGSLRFKPKVPITIARALDALHLQLHWALLRYTIPDPRIWTEMTELYTLAQSQGVAMEAVSVYTDRSSSVTQTFVKGLMIAASSNDTLRPAELDLAMRLVDCHASHFVMADQPFEGSTHWFDMAQPSAPVRTTKPPPEGVVVQYIGAGAALAELESVEAQFAYSGAMPPPLVFYAKQDNQVLLAVIKHLAQDWSGKTQARQDERKKITSRVTVVPGLDEICRALDFSVNDSLDFTDQPVAESWVVEDASTGGYGAVIPSVKGDWVEVGSLVGVEGSSIRDWRLGVIRRVNRLDGNQQRVGMQLLGDSAVLVVLTHNHAPGAEERRGSPRPESAVLITRDVEMQEQVEVLVRSGSFTKLDDVKMALGQNSFRLRPVKVVERSAHAERVAFQVLPEK